MFTGIVESKGTLISVVPLDDSESGGSGYSLTIGDAQIVLADVHLGDSIAVNGTCLTVTEFNPERSVFKVGVSPETLRKTCLGDLRAGDHVNLERAMSGSSRFGGHMVQGHVDCTVNIVSKTLDPPNSYIYAFKVPEASIDTGNRDLLSLIVPKGYVCLDGVSLTVIDVDRNERTFTIMMIPFTQERVTLFNKKPKDRVNLEVDAISKHVQGVVMGMMQGSIEMRGIFEEMIDRLVEKKLANRKDN